MAAMNPPTGTIELIEKHLVRFFWGSTNEKTKHHWSSWENLCKPKDEGVIGIKRIQDITDTSATKRWWNFRTKQSSWASFLLAKYCTRVHPVARKKAVGHESNAWRKFLATRLKVEYNIIWKINMSTCSFWWDNWMDSGALANHFQPASKFNKIKVRDYLNGRTWNEQKLNSILPESVVSDILTVKLGICDNQDYGIWKPSMDGNFTNKTAWQCIRNQSPKTRFLNHVWQNKIPFKISFLSWRMLRRKLHFDKLLVSLEYSLTLLVIVVLTLTMNL